MSEVPSDIIKLLQWAILPETLFAFFLIYLKLPLVVKWADWQKGAVFTVVGSVASAIVVAIQQSLTPDLISKVQPFVNPFILILNLVLTYYGIQSVKRQLTTWWSDRQKANKARAAADIANRLGRAVDESLVKEFLTRRDG